MAERVRIITVRCPVCGYTDKRRGDNPFTVHRFTHDVCPSCNGNLEVDGNTQEEDVKTTDPVEVMAAKQKKLNNPLQETLKEAPYPWMVWKVDHSVTMEENFSNMIEALRKISASKPDDIQHLEFQLAVNNAKWELIKAKAAVKKLYGGNDESN